MQGKWPKIFPPLTPEQERISHDFMQYWHETLAGQARYGLVEKFNHGYPIKYAPKNFLRTLEIGAGLGEHLCYEKLTPIQKKNYVALELRENMAAQLRQRFPGVQTLVGNCEEKLPFSDSYFDRIIAIHVLEHLPNLPAAIQEMYRLCDKDKGSFTVVIPCEGGWMYSLARKLSAQRLFEKRYKQSYQWFIEREHINLPNEIIVELKKYFKIRKKSFFPSKIPWVNSNLIIGMTLEPHAE